MKRILFGYQFSDGHVPFWKPWGCMGCLGNLLIFLLLLLLLLFLLSMLRNCSNHSRMPSEFNRPGDVYQPGDSTAKPDAPSDSAWNQPIAGAEDTGLPAPDDNVLPPFNEEETIPDPDNGGATKIYPNLLYVILDSQADDTTFKKFAAKFTQLYPQPESKIQCYNSSAKTLVLSVPQEKRADICRQLPSQISDVKFLVVPVEVMAQGSGVRPNDPAFNYPDVAWYFNPIQAFDAWSITQGSEDIVIGIVDSYMDISHEELRGNRCVYPFSVVKGNTDVAPRPGAPMDYAGHGTLVTSVATGNMGNGKGSCGIAPKCRFMPVSMGEHLNTITMVEGLLYCMYHGADVINLSCGTNFPDEVKRMSVEEQVKLSKQYGRDVERMWDYVFHLAEERNVTIVWAAGNDNVYTAMDCSKRGRNTIRVSAVDRNLHRADFSNFGNFPSLNVAESTISAPGVDIFGALPGNTYDMWPGTSFSAPIITGVVALMKSINANLTTQEIIRIMQETGKPVEGSPEIGRLVQIKDALMKVKAQIGNFSTNKANLLGTWETTRLSKYVDDNEVPTGDKGKVRITFKPDMTAEIRYCLTDGDVYPAPAVVRISINRVDVIQTQLATLPGKSSTFKKHVYSLVPDAQHKTQCLIILNNKERERCYIRKIANA